MSDDQEMTELDEHARRLFAALPRESVPDPREIDHIVGALKVDGFLRPATGRRTHRAAQLAAAVALLVLGGLVGARYATRNSLESRLERTDLSVSDRILLMQRAGSAYVRAANGYAGAVAKTDSSAVEVASRVLIGAAQAVARTDLDGGLSPRLAAALGASSANVPRATPQRVIWF